MRNQLEKCWAKQISHEFVAFSEQRYLTLTCARIPISIRLHKLCVIKSKIYLVRKKLQIREISVSPSIFQGDFESLSDFGK